MRQLAKLERVGKTAAESKGFEMKVEHIMHVVAKIILSPPGSAKASTSVQHR